MNRASWASVWIIAVFIGGCVIETAAATPTGVAVSGPPPEPVYEARPSTARAQGIWIAGYWHWTGLQYTWIPGHWEDGPPGARWRAPRYLLRDGVYYYEPGRWWAPVR
jgi:hypothetical protein